MARKAPANGPRKAAARLFAGLLLSIAGGCIDLGGVMDVAFPAAVPGLRPDQPWFSLPIRSWLVGGGIEVRAISACTAPSCEAQSAVAVFAAQGRDGAELARILDDPARLARQLLADPSPMSPRGRERGAGKPLRSRGTATVEPRREGALSGFSIRLARTDGSHPAFGYVLAARRPTMIALVLVVSTSEDTARRVALDVAPHLG